MGFAGADQRNTAGVGGFVNVHDERFTSNPSEDDRHVAHYFIRIMERVLDTLRVCNL